MLPLALLTTLLLPIAATPADPTLAAAIGGQRWSAVEKRLQELVAANSSAAIDTIIEGALLSDRPRAEELAQESLAYLRPGEAFDHICLQCNRHPRHEVRDQLTGVLAYRNETSAFRAVLINLYDKEPTVVIAAAVALRKKKDLAAVRHLIKALAHQESKLRQRRVVAHKIRQSLRSLTGGDFEEAAEWRRFFDDNEKAIRAGRFGSEPRRGSSGVVARVPRFFGVEVRSERVVFLLDVSISMKESDPLPEGESSGAEPSKDSRMRIRRVQRELARLIGGLSKDTRFTVISFSSKIDQLSPALLPANAANKRKARAFVAAFEPGGQTHTDEALEAALSIRDVTSIFLLSDGAPVRNGTLIDPPGIFERVRAVNRFRRVSINTVGFRGTERSIGSFLREIARQNEGEYRELP